MRRPSSRQPETAVVPSEYRRTYEAIRGNQRSSEAIRRVIRGLSQGHQRVIRGISEVIRGTSEAARPRLSSAFMSE